MGKVLINPRSLGGSEIASPIRVFLLHRCRLANDAIAASLRRCPQIELVGAACEPRDAVGRLQNLGLEVAVVDVSLEGGGAVELVRGMCRAGEGFEVLVMGMESEDEVVDLIEAGARGYVLRGASLTRLLSQIQALRRGEAPCSPRVAAEVFARLEKLSSRVAPRNTGGVPEFTPRQREVLELIAEGDRNKEIAKKLEISVPTVKNHVHRILERLQVRHRREAIQQAYELGLLEDPLPRRVCAGSR